MILAFLFKARNDVEVQLLEEEENPEKGKKSSFEGMVSSENIESLIKALEFNTIDIYRYLHQKKIFFLNKLNPKRQLSPNKLGYFRNTQNLKQAL